MGTGNLRPKGEGTSVGFHMNRRQNTQGGVVLYSQGGLAMLHLELAEYSSAHWGMRRRQRPKRDFQVERRLLLESGFILPLRKKNFFLFASDANCF